MTALPLSDAQLATIRLGKPGTQFTGKPVIALDAIYPQNGAFRICADHLYTALAIPTSEYLTLEPAPTCASLSEVHGAGLTEATAGVAASFVVTARDTYSNLRQVHEDSWLSVVERADAGDAAIDAVISQTLTPGVSAVHYTATVAGAYTVHVMRPRAGGLLGHYYNNMWMVGDVKEEHVDAQVDFDWQTRSVSPTCGPAPGDQMLCPMGQDYVSVVWSGFFKAEFSESYTFWLDSDDGSRLYLRGQKVLACLACLACQHAWQRAAAQGCWRERAGLLHKRRLLTWRRCR